MRMSVKTNFLKDGKETGCIHDAANASLPCAKSSLSQSGLLSTISNYFGPTLPDNASPITLNCGTGLIDTSSLRHKGTAQNSQLPGISLARTVQFANSCRPGNQPGRSPIQPAQDAAPYTLPQRFQAARHFQFLPKPSLPILSAGAPPSQYVHSPCTCSACNAPSPSALPHQPSIPMRTHD